MRRAAVCAVAVGVGLAGCAPKAYLRPGFAEQPPRRVAVLPFVSTYNYDVTDEKQIHETQKIGREIFRKQFYKALTPYGYEDIKLADVDRTLAEKWPGGWENATPQELGQALGADALVYGDVSRLIYFITPIFSEASVAGELRLVEASSGEVLWKIRVKERERGGAAVQKGQVVDFVQDQLRSFNTEEKLTRVADLAVRRALNKNFPDPAMAVGGTDASGSGTGTVRLAILPLGFHHKKADKASARLRRSLAANLQDGAFEVLELRRIDTALETAGWKQGEELDQALLAQVAQLVGADAFLRGTTTSWGRTYAVLESWVKAGMKLELLDAATGAVIWSDDDTNTRHAGISKGPTGYKSIVTAPIMGMKKGHLEKVAEHLAREMVADMQAAPEVKTFLQTKQ